MVFCLLSQRQLEAMPSADKNALRALNVEVTVDSVSAASASTDAWLLPAHSNAWRSSTLLTVLSVTRLVSLHMIVTKQLHATCVLITLASTDAL